MTDDKNKQPIPPKDSADHPGKPPDSGSNKDPFEVPPSLLRRLEEGKVSRNNKDRETK